MQALTHHGRGAMRRDEGPDPRITDSTDPTSVILCFASSDIAGADDGSGRASDIATAKVFQHKVAPHTTWPLG